MLAALSDPIRLEIARRLQAEPGEHGWGAFEMPVCKSTLSHHVKVLREAGVIRHRKEGTRCWIAANPCLDEAFPGLLDAILSHSGGPGGLPPESAERDAVAGMTLDPAG